ncbi:hypothetical protein HDU76_012365 [Blyttiomyces sp. JEL0837]|nr:hypothetical protein HDU76_012365 [Blyttiomyces sp. JEL0837]
MSKSTSIRSTKPGPKHQITKAIINSVNDATASKADTPDLDATTSDPDMYMTYYDTNATPTDPHYIVHNQQTIFNITYRLRQVLLDHKRLPKQITLAMQRSKKHAITHSQNPSPPPPPRCCLPISVDQVETSANRSTSRILPRSMKLKVLRVQIYHVIFGVHGICIMVRDKHANDCILVLLEHPNPTPQNFDDPVDFIAHITQQYPVNSDITIIEPYCEIDSCGRKVIRVWDSNYMMTWKEVENSDEIEAHFERLSVLKVLYEDALAFYNSQYLTDCLDLCVFGYKKFADLHSLEFFDHLSLASSELYALGDYWNAFRVGMIGVVFKGDINFGGQALQLMVTSVVLERLDMAEEAFHCIKWAKIFTAKIKDRSTTCVGEIDQVMDRLKKQVGYSVKPYDVEGLARLLISRDFDSLGDLLDGKDCGKEAGMFDELDDHVKALRSQEHSILLLKRGKEFSQLKRRKEALYCHLSGLVQCKVLIDFMGLWILSIFKSRSFQSSIKKGDYEDIWKIIIPLFLTLSFWQPFSDWRVYVVVCECLMMVEMWQEFDKVAEDALETWPKCMEFVYLRKKKEELVKLQQQQEEEIMKSRNKEKEESIEKRNKVKK